jgi:hypothetical protein
MGKLKHNRTMGSRNVINNGLYHIIKNINLKNPASALDATPSDKMVR